MAATVYLIPTYLHEQNLEVLPSYILETIEKCAVLFVENERTARRYLKQLKKKSSSITLSGLASRRQKNRFCSNSGSSYNSKRPLASLAKPVALVLPTRASCWLLPHRMQELL